MPKIARACMLAMILLFPALTLGAGVTYVFDCDPSSGFMSDPNAHKRVGYITSLQGLAVPPASFAADLRVASPYRGPSPGYTKALPTGGTAAVVGIIESFKWAGGLGDPIEINFYVSLNNAALLKGLMQQTLKSTKIDQLGWWIVDYDQGTKTWYEQAYPLSSPTISGTLANKSAPDLNVNLAPVTLNNVTVYKVSMKVAPPANLQQVLAFATSSAIRTAKPWGLKVGALPPGSM